MSVDMYIKRSSGAEESVPVCHQRTAEDFIGGLARAHGFRIFKGMYPVWVYEDTLDQALVELKIIRAAAAEAAATNERFSDENRTYWDGRWEKVIAILESLAREKDWEATFG